MREGTLRAGGGRTWPTLLCLLLLLLLASASRAAAINVPVPLSRIVQPLHTLPAPAQAPPAPAQAPPASAQAPAVRHHKAMVKEDLCTIKREAKLEPEPVPEGIETVLQPRHLPSLALRALEEGEAAAGWWPEERTMLTLPEGCQYTERMSFKSVLCSGPNITVVPSFPFARHLEYLHFVSTNIQMVSEVSGLPRTLQTLAFTLGQLSIFDGRKLYQIAKLESLWLDHNTLSKWSFSSAFYDPNAPSPVTLTYLSLQDNLITYPPDPVGGNETVLPMLQTLDMSNNPMCNLPTKLFQPLKNSPVTTLYLKNCSLSQVPQAGSPLEPLAGLEVLDLSSNMGLAPNEVEQLLTPLKGGHLTQLSLANNNYASAPYNALSLVSNSLEVLDLHGSAFECLDNSSFPYFPRLLRLNLKYCRINNIRTNTFEGFPVLEELNLDGNGLVTIPTEVLLPSLKVLTLSENPRSTGSGSPESFTMNQVDFGSMTNLTNLTFQLVPLGGVEASYFNDLSGLLELRLTACNIAYIEDFSFVNLTRLEWLYLNQNELGILYNNTFAGLVSLVHLDLSQNNIIVHSNTDVTMPKPASLLLQKQQNRPRRVSSSVRSRMEMLLDMPKTVVRWLQGDSTQTLLAHQAKKTKVEGKMDEGATVVEDGVTRDGIPMVEADRRHANIYLPFRGLSSLRHLDMSENELWALVPELWQNLNSLVTLKLGSNNIQSWDHPVFVGLTSLKELCLAKNSLNQMTDAMVVDFSLDNLAIVDLRYNHFQCSCEMTTFNETFNSSLFVEYTTYQCTEAEEVWAVSEYITNATCRESVTTPRSVVEGGGGGGGGGGITVETIIIITSVMVSLLMTSATLYKKRWYIRYLVHTARMKTMNHKEDDQHYLYDTFVCYSQADRQWVFEHLVARLEDGGKRGYRVCVHERDFAVGQEITDNIITSVEKSRKVVMVLSPAFVESSWCMFELQLASNKILDERRNKLILILLKPLLPQNQPKKLRLLLRTRTYLPWVDDVEGQLHFWARLMRVVAKPSASETPGDFITHL